MLVQAATLADAEAMRAIYNDAVANTTATMDTEPRSSERQEAWLAAHDGDPYPALVAVDAAGAALGWAALSPYNPKPGYRTTAEVSVYVHPARRGQGVGSALLGALVDAARERGFCLLLSLVTADNEASLRLHARHGFTFVGTLRRVGRKFNAWVDVTFLEKRLDDD